METQQPSRSVHPATWIPTLYFAMGLPFVAIATASTLMFKNLGISDTRIAFWTSLIMLPWTLKPLWGPFLEMFKTKKHFVIITQMLTGITFCLVAFSLPLDDFFRFAIALLAVIAFSGATHDIAADGIYLNVLSTGLQAKYIGWQGAFYNIAKILTGGAIVYLAGQMEVAFGVVKAWMVVMGLYGIIMIILALYHLRRLPSGGRATEVTTFRDGINTLWDVIRTFFEKKKIWWFLLFIILYRFAEGHAIKIAPLFFKAARDQGGLGLSTSQIGLVYGVFGALAFVAGSILAGYYVSRRGLKRTLFILCCFFNIPFAVYAFLAMVQPTSLAIIGSAVVLEYFGYGFGFVGLMLFMMQQVAPGKYKMAHYAFASGIMNLGFMIPSMLSGLISDRLGYRAFFIWVLIATIPSFLVSFFVPFTQPENTD
jgi:PAT family beta-lactamase induction signal transducer AmpG